jgi:hypothetical protein
MDTQQPLKRPDYPMPEDFKILGRPELSHRVVAVKVCGDQWPTRFLSALHAARRAFDRGTHMMAQGKHPDGWIIQYLIPRKRPLRNPRPYFSRSVIL